MYIPPNDLARKMHTSKPEEGVYLESMHICFDKTVSEQVFKEELNVYLSYYPKKSYIIMAPISHEFFKKMHESSQHMLKIKNASGAKSIALHELMIDHEIETPEGPLKYEIREKTDIIKIYLS